MAERALWVRFGAREPSTMPWIRRSRPASKVLFAIFAQLGVRGEQAQHALRILRSFVRGFVLHEMGASFLEPLEHDQSYELGIRLFIEGLNALRN